MHDPDLDCDDLNPYAAPKGDLAPPPAPPTAPIERGNPWLTIWTRPRATIRAIVATDPTRQVGLLVFLSGIANALGRAEMQDLGDRLPLGAILGACAVGGPIGGALGLYLGGALLQITGGWLGGRATSKEVRAALAWASVPMVALLVLWAPVLALTGNAMFTSTTPHLGANPMLGLAYIAFGVAQLVLGVWYAVLALKCVGEVHGFSAWRALAAVILTILMAALIVGGIVLAVVLAMRGK